MQLLMLGLIGLLLSRSWFAFFHNGITYADEIRIAAEPFQVWTYLVQPESRVDWQPGVRDVVGLSEGQGRVGDRALVLYRAGGAALEIEEKLIALNPPYLWAATQSSTAFTATIEIKLSRLGEMTVVTYREKRILAAFADRYLAPWLQWKKQRRLGRALRRLKLLVEREAATEAKPD